MYRFFVVLLGVFLSCSRKEVLEQRQSSVFETQEYLEGKALSLRSSLFASGLRAKEDLRVSDFSYLSMPRLRSEDSNRGNLGVCVVNFAEDKGFAILTTGDKIAPIAIVDKGYFDVQKQSDHQADTIIYQILSFAIEDLISFPDNPLQSPIEYTYDRHVLDSLGFDVVDLIEHKVHTRWNQSTPYFSKNNHKYAGCVAVALSQIFTFYGTIENPIAGRKIDWDGLSEESIRNNGELTRTSPKNLLSDVEEVLWWIGQNSDASYGERGTGMSSKKALELAQRNGFICNPRMQEYNLQEVVNALRKGNLTYMEGFRGEKDPSGQGEITITSGHAWLLDGYAKVKERTKEEEYELVHVNWGWGNSRSLNGYYYANSFCVNTDVGSLFPTTEELRTDNDIRNYEYFIKMSQVYPKRKRVKLVVKK